MAVGAVDRAPRDRRGELGGPVDEFGSADDGRWFRNDSGHGVIVVAGVGKSDTNALGVHCIYGDADVPDYGNLIFVVADGLQVFNRNVDFGTRQPGNVRGHLDILQAIRKFATHFDREIPGLRKLGIALPEAFPVATVAYIGIRETEWIYGVSAMHVRGRSGHRVQ